MTRVFLRLALAAVSGFAIGLLGPITLFAALCSTAGEQTLLLLALGGGLGAVNGAFGALAGQLWGRGRAGLAMVLPLLLLLYPLASFLQASKAAGADLVVFGLLGVFTWAAGRVGQQLGGATTAAPPAVTVPPQPSAEARQAEPSAAADPARDRASRNP